MCIPYKHFAKQTQIIFYLQLMTSLSLFYITSHQHVLSVVSYGVYDKKMQNMHEV